MKLIAFIVLIICITAQLSAQQNDFRLSLNDIPTNLNSTLVNKSAGHIQKTPGEKDFTFTVNPYLWTVAIGGAVQLPSTYPYYFGMNFADAVSDLKMAAMVGGRFKYKSVSLLYDVTYFKIKPELYVPVSTGYVSGTSELQEFAGDFSLAYRLPLNNRNIQLDIYGGTRVWSLSNKLDLTASNGLTSTNEQSKTWVDPIIGIGGNFILTEYWYSYFKADIGGFTASSDWTTMFVWAFGYKFSDHWNGSMGVKELYIDYDKDKFMWNVSQYGLLFTIGYQF